jgi:hypothetical protein
MPSQFPLQYPLSVPGECFVIPSKLFRGLEKPRAPEVSPNGIVGGGCGTAAGGATADVVGNPAVGDAKL